MKGFIKTLKTEEDQILYKASHVQMQLDLITENSNSLRKVVFNRPAKSILGRIFGWSETVVHSGVFGPPYNFTNKEWDYLCSNGFVFKEL